MEYLVNAKEMKAYDENTSREFLLPPIVLMERAAEAFTEEFTRRMSPGSTVIVLCGSGNNGGDGLAIARLLFQRGYAVSLLLTGKSGKDSLAETELFICRKYGITELSELPEKATDAVIDAIFGTGLTRNVEGECAELLERVNAWDCFRAAVDIPSGISADHGRVMGVAFRADLTVTFAFRKLGQILYPGSDYCGELLCRDIGITADSFCGTRPRVCAFTEADREKLPPRANDSNKGDYGRVLVIAGSVNMCGAAFFAAKAAYLAGAGLVRIYTPEENRVILQTRLPEAILTTYRSDRFEEKGLIEAIHWADTVLIGPGLSTGDTADRIFHTTLRSVSVPLVIDADGLNLLARETEQLKRPHTDIVLTPHIGEMARLTGDSVMYLKEERIARAAEFANEYNVILTMKDSRTVTAVPYGRIYLNRTGNHGMASGGSGDVLSGFITGLIATGADTETAAGLGAYLHGRAGELAAERKGARAMSATDILDALPEVLA